MNRFALVLYGFIAFVFLIWMVPLGHAQENRSEERRFGIEFFTYPIYEKRVTQNDVTFDGHGSDGITQSETVDLKIDLDNPGYDIGLFYRIDRIKLGWIPTSLLHDKTYRGVAAEYDLEWGPWPLGIYEIDTNFMNLLYLDLSALKAKKVTGNLLVRLDRAEIKGELSVIKYPSGDEWHQAPIVLGCDGSDEDFYIISVGPKFGINLKSMALLSQSILAPFEDAGLDISAFYDLPLGTSDYQGYSVNVSLALAF